MGGPKHGDKRFDRILGIGIPDLLMNLMSCHGFFKEHKYCCHIKMSQKDIGIIFLKMIYYFGMKLK